MDNKKHSDEDISPLNNDNLRISNNKIICEDWALTKKCGKTKYVNLSKCEVRGGGCRESLKDKW